MRPPAIERMGYYPTDEPVVEIICTYLKPSVEKGRLFDPCAGEGKAASTLGKALNCETWGVELSPDRAEKAQNVMDKVYQAPWQSCVLSDESVTWLYLNPPYEFDRFEGQKRLEWDFLKTTTSKLMRGGLLTYIIPKKILGMIEVARLLAGHYEAITVYRFPDGLYEKLKQVVVLAYKRKLYQPPTDKEVLSLQNLATEELEPIETAVEPAYELLVAPSRGANGKPIVFKRTDWELEEVVEATMEAGVQNTSEWLDLIHPTRGLTQLAQPVMPLKKGHIAMLMASGMMGTVRLTDEDGKPMLIKGRVIKVVEKIEQPDTKDTDAVIETFKDRFVTTVAVLRQDGIQIIQDVKGLSDFMKAHGEKIAAHVLETYKPLYNLDPTPKEIAVLDAIGTHRKPLPGQERAGLLPAQRHAAAALARSIRKQGVANMQGEMGVGKASANTARVYTPDGYKLMGEIRVGDFVIGSDGNPTRVLGVYPQGDQDIYRVKFSDGSATDVTGDHLWEINSPLRKWKGYPATLKTTKEILSGAIAHKNGNQQVFIPMVQPVNFTPREVALDPYLLGLLLGDGGLSDGRVNIATADVQILEEIRSVLPPGVMIKPVGKYDYYLSTGRTGGKENPIKRALRFLQLDDHLSCQKFIPREYLYNSVKVRTALLQGLLDTDGYVLRRSCPTIEFTTTSQQLSSDMVDLVQSLGGVARVKQKRPTYIYKGERRFGLLSYRMTLKLPPEIMPFRLSRKIERYKIPTKYLPSRSVVGIEYVGKAPATCIYVEDPRHLYATDNFILTHNTTIGTAVIDLLEAYPAIVICPPHLVPKWIREIEEVIPGAHARELRRIGRNSDEAQDVNDVRDFLDQYRQASETAKRTGGSKPKWIAVVAHTSAKFGTGWQPAVIWRKTRDPLTGKVVDACACPSCGKVVVAEKDGFVIPVTDLNELAEKRQFCRNHVPGWELDPDGRIKLDANGDPVWGSHACKTPLFEFAGARRHSIADYIAKHAQGKFTLLIADESHQFKSKSSDRGVAFHQLVTAAKWTLTLTGTFFGGKSTSIFWLLHRLNHGVRRDFAFHDEKRWARLYGVLETTRRRRRDDDADEDGVYTGNRRYRNQAKEQPGVSPAIVSRLLDTTIFLSLKDLNLALPAYKEEVVALDMLDDQGQQYHNMDSSLKQLAVQSSRYLSTWLQWSLARPNSAFRDEVVVVDEVDGEDGKSVRKVPLMELPAINPNGHKWLPKENWLADFCKLEKQQGRKVLIYIRQTGTRDIQDRVQMPLQANGLRVSILGGNVDPRKREEWIAKRVNTIDALICNPRLVETGLDLVQFSSVVFFEIEYSLYTLWQSVRRVWRLGQTQPVKAIFSVYSTAMEATALALMGRKMKAAQLVYGDEVGGAIVPEEEGDFLTQLARDVLDGAKLSDLQTLFADDLQVSHNPMGSLTTPSAMIVPGPKVMTWDDWVSQKTVVVRRTKRKEVVPEGQMEFGI